MSDFTELVDLAAARVGGKAVEANDEFFAPKENLLKAGCAIYIEGKYTSRGKWMDGWETRRRREPGHDWCVVKLGLPGVIRGVDVDTQYFKGNFPESFSLEASSGAKGPWTEILGKTALKGDAQNLHAVDDARLWSFVRLNIHPDGGVARFRVYGEVVPRLPEGEIDLAAVEHGGAVLAANDMFFGSRHNLIMPGRSRSMADGWETRRKRQLPGSDWVVLRLAAAGVVRRVEIDTNFFKGNFPESASLAAGPSPEGPWTEILPRTKLRAHRRHFFKDEVTAAGPFTHARFTIYPDGGVSRLRLFGTVPDEERARLALRRLDILPIESAEAALLAVCGSRHWATRMAALRPFTSLPHLLETASTTWKSLEKPDFLEAFASHRKIGQGPKSGEQAGMKGASPKTLAALRKGNRDYEKKFGHTFIVCAAGQGADAMLAALEERLRNSPEAELRNAAEEEAKITKKRLENLR